LIQSRIAIGAGELWGQGLKQVLKPNSISVPEQHTDFICYYEELVCWRSCSVVWLLVNLLRLLLIVQNAKDNFGSYCNRCFINAGVSGNCQHWHDYWFSTCNRIPLPCKLRSLCYADNFIAIGIVESVENYRQRLKF